MKRNFIGFFLMMGLVGLPANSQAQDLVGEALASFPPQTIRVEYSSPTELRALSNYASLHQRYVGPRLQKLGIVLGELGVREEDVDTLMLGWQAGKTEMDLYGLYGLAAGRFDSRTLAASARERGIAPSEVAGQQAYCLEAGGDTNCLLVLSPSLGAFGSLTLLRTLLEIRAGQATSLNSESNFKQVLDETRKDTPIWGAAMGSSVGDWFRGWIPNEGNLKLDWAKVFQDVDSLAYSVDAGESVNLDLKMDCKSTDAATSLHQILESLKMAQQIAWQNQNPGRPNPFRAMEVDLDGRQVSLRLTTAYTELELAKGFGAQTP